MLTITRHAKQRAVSRLGFERTKAASKLNWLYREARPVAGPSLPKWFRPIPKRYAPTTRFGRTTYAGLEIIFVTVPMATGEALVTVITNADQEDGIM